MVFTVKIHSTETIYTTEIKFCACVNNGNLMKKTLKKYCYKLKNCELHKNQWSNEKIIIYVQLVADFIVS